MSDEQQNLLNFISPENLKKTEDAINSMEKESSPCKASPIPNDFPPKHDTNRTHEAVKNITSILNYPVCSFERFLDVSLAAVEGRENDYMEIIKNMKRKELDAYVKCFCELYNFFLDGYYDDVLGNYYQQNNKSRNGYFITPFHVSLMMAEMLDIKQKDTLCEPCCGSGSMLLAAKFVIHKKYGWQASCYYLPKMYGMDVCDTYVKMCKLQLYLSNYLHMISRTYEAVMDIKQKESVKE